MSAMSLTPAKSPVPAVARPNFTIVLVMLSVAFFLSTMFSLRPDGSDGVAVANVNNIPGDRGDWRWVREVPLPSSLMDEMKADSYTDRIYQNMRSGQALEIMVVYRRYGRREFAHRPDQCYPAAGFNITSKDNATLPYAGRDVDVVHMTADGSHVQRTDGGVGVPNETLTYFFASGARTESDFMRQQLIMAFERLIPNKNGWTFLRLSSLGQTTDAVALDAQKDFMKTYGPAIQQVITTDASSSSPTTEGQPQAAAVPAAPADAFGSFK